MIAVAALSARWLAEAAAADGEPAVALDLFGDVDTCRAASEWHPIGSGQGLRIDDRLFRQAIGALAARGDVEGWVDGSGFEDRIDLLDEAAALLPLIGNPAAALRRLADARDFFATLDRLGIAHPEVRFDPASPGAGWLSKNAASSGGTSVVRGRRPLVSTKATCWQREVEGVPMSATFVADGEDAVVLGFNRQLCHETRERPFLFAGVIGPIAVDRRIESALTHAVRALAATYRLQGLGSVDFVAAGSESFVLEVNARPPASAVLYPVVGAGSALRAHLDACRQRRLPDAPPPGAPVRGIEIVFARRSVDLDAAGAASIGARPCTHDLPRAGQRLGAGHPLCSVSAAGPDGGAVRAELARSRDALLEELETRR